MANLIKWGPYPAAAAYLGVGLNALADGANAIGAAIDNTTAHNMYLDAELTLAVQAAARSAGAYVALYVLASVNGANYCYGDAAVDPPAHAFVGAFALDAVVTARITTLTHILLPAGKFKMLVINETGRAFNNAGNTLKYTVYNEEIQ